MQCQGRSSAGAQQQCVDSSSQLQCNPRQSGKYSPWRLWARKCCFCSPRPCPILLPLCSVLEEKKLKHITTLLYCRQNVFIPSIQFIAQLILSAKMTPGVVQMNININVAHVHVLSISRALKSIWYKVQACRKQQHAEAQGAEGYKHQSERFHIWDGSESPAITSAGGRKTFQ